MNRMVRVTEVEALDGFRIRAGFSDGALKEIDLEDLFRQGGVFEPIRRSRELFLAARVNLSGAVEWPDEVDLDPEILYGSFEPASGARLHRTTLREPAATPG